jgi:tetratricopeptide (TPR) repeat protein
MAAETIAGLVEYAELHDSECLAKRLEVLRHPTSARLGPPDLCYIKKRKVGSGAFSSLFYDETVGYFHWRLGLALDKGVLSIVQYLRGLLDEQEQLDWSSWVVPTAQYKISYFHYCTYNPFRSIDVHLETRKMRGESEEEDMVFDVYAVDKHGKRSAIQRDDVALWKELRIAGVLRYMARQLSLDGFDPKITPLHLNEDCLTCFASREFLPLPDLSPSPDSIAANSPSASSASLPPSRSGSRMNLSVENLKPTNPAPGPISLVGPMSAEEAFLEFLVPFLPSGQLLGSYIRHSTPTITNNLMIQIPFKYLLRQGCSNVMIDFACRMSIDVPELIALESKARRKTPAFVDPDKKSPNTSAHEDDASSANDEDPHASCVNALLQAVIESPNSLDMLIELSITLFAKGERVKALEYAILATQQHPEDFRALYTAAKIHALSNHPELALDFLFAVPVCQPPPCKDFVGVAFHRYATEPHYDHPNADQCRRIEEVDLAAMEESEAELSLNRANLNKTERQFYRLFHTIIKISGKDVLIKLIRERASKLKDAQEKARIAHRKALEVEAENRPPPRSKRARLTQSQANKASSSSSNASSASTDDTSVGDEVIASISLSSTVPITKSLAESRNAGISLASSETVSGSESAEDPEFFVIDMNQPLPPPLAYNLDVTYDTTRHAYLSLLEDLGTVEKWTVLPAMSVAALVRLGLIHKRLGAYDLALEAFETAITLGWSFRGCRELCFLHVQAGKVRQVLESTDRSLRHLTHRWGTSYPDWQLRAALWRVVARKSLKHVLHILENLQEVNDWHPFLRRCLEDAPYHQVDNSSL